MSEFQDFVRKQFPVQAARVTPMNIEELAEACGGKIMHDGEKEGNFSRDYIKVRVAFPLNEEQTKARIGDWLVKQGRTFKVYKDKPFRSTFENRDGTPVPGGNQQKKKKGKPSPSDMPKKKNMEELVRESQTEASVAEQQATFAAEQEKKAQKMERDEVLESAQVANPENQVAEAVEQTPPPAEETPKVIENAKIVSANLVEGPPDPSKGIHPVEIVEPKQEMEAESAEVPADMEPVEKSFFEQKAEVDEIVEQANEQEKKPITLDELNERPGDPRTADDIHREGQQQG